jgi:hypothetical protein
MKKADLRISIKDYHRNKNLKIQLVRVPFASTRQFWVSMNGKPWSDDGRPVSINHPPLPVSAWIPFALNGHF